jgi:acetyl-CoA carboxylase biotin carboxyl carrier protein
MELKKITELMDLMARSDLTELQLQEGEDSLRLLRGVGAAGAAESNPPRADLASARSSEEIVAAKRHADKAQSEGPAAAPATREHQVFKSPMVGTFYRAGAPGDNPFVEVGQKVELGQALGVIEAMKMLTELECDVDGQIAEILVENGAFVEFGQPLFSIK